MHSPSALTLVCRFEDFYPIISSADMIVTFANEGFSYQVLPAPCAALANPGIEPPTPSIQPPLRRTLSPKAKCLGESVPTQRRSGSRVRSLSPACSPLPLLSVPCADVQQVNRSTSSVTMGMVCDVPLAVPDTLLNKYICMRSAPLCRCSSCCSSCCCCLPFSGAAGLVAPAPLRERQQSAAAPVPLCSSC